MRSILCGSDWPSAPAEEVTCSKLRMLIRINKLSNYSSARGPSSIQTTPTLPAHDILYSRAPIDSLVMNTTFFTRCLRTTPSSLLLRQQIPKPQPRSSWPRKTTLAYSTNTNAQRKGPDSNKKVEEASAEVSSSREQTTPPSDNTNSTPANENTSSSSIETSRSEYSKGLLDSLRLRQKQASPYSMTSPSNTGSSTENNDPLKDLRGSMEAIQAPSKHEKLPVREYIRSSVQAKRPKPMLKTVPMKLGPKLGRQVMVQNDRGLDCATAIRSLEKTCNANNLRRQVAAQRFHVRRGQARKNLKIARWRKLFKFSFLATIRKIDRMRDQGW